MSVLSEEMYRLGTSDETAELLVKAEDVWHAAKEASDFDMFFGPVNDWNRI